MSRDLPSPRSFCLCFFISLACFCYRCFTRSQVQISHHCIHIKHTRINCARHANVLEDAWQILIFAHCDSVFGAIEGITYIGAKIHERFYLYLSRGRNYPSFDSLFFFSSPFIFLRCFSSSLPLSVPPNFIKLSRDHLSVWFGLNLNVPLLELLVSYFSLPPPFIPHSSAIICLAAACY